MMEKIKHWVLRYGPAEVFATIGAVGGASLAYFFTKNFIVAAFAGSISENIGYYGYIFTREYGQARAEHRVKKESFGFSGILKLFKNLIMEFGFSELLDSLVVRALAMYWFPLIIGNHAAGIVVGKVVADLVFYIPTILIYELRRK
jgi:hypothetical protein